MTTEDKIKVMQAYVNGEQIQYHDGIDWCDFNPVTEPIWGWDEWAYRIKPEEKKPTYRPYKNTAEMIADYKERFKVNVPPYAKPLIWVKQKSNGNIQLIEGYSPILVYVLSGWWTLKVINEGFTYLDGSPVGKLVEE